MVVLDRYSVVDDFGVLVAPNLVEGQVHGGIAQTDFGQAVTEWLVQDDAGGRRSPPAGPTPLPGAADLPFISFAERGIPTRTDPLGMKGCGEGPNRRALGAISNAVRDALAPGTPGGPALHRQPRCRDRGRQAGHQPTASVWEILPLGS